MYFHLSINYFTIKYLHVNININDLFVWTPEIRNITNEQLFKTDCIYSCDSLTSINHFFIIKADFKINSCFIAKIYSRSVWACITLKKNQHANIARVSRQRGIVNLQDWRDSRWFHYPCTWPDLRRHRFSVHHQEWHWPTTHQPQNLRRNVPDSGIRCSRKTLRKTG